MGDVFILNDYGKLGKHGEHLLYTNSKGETQSILPFKTEMIILSGFVSITAEGFQLLSKNKISVFFVGRGNSNNIRLDYGQGKNVFLRQQQYRIIDSNKGFEVAKEIVRGKVQNQINFLKKQKKYHPYVEIQEVILRLKKIIKDIDVCNEITALRGYEGFAAKLYFSAFDFLLIPEWAVFGSRSKHPPKTNVNAVLSYLYSILICKIQRYLESMGLDTMASNLHELCYGKDTLAYDLVEEFRAPFADALCIKLFNKGILQEDDFEERDDGIYLSPNGASKVIKKFEEKMESNIFYGRTQEDMTFNEIMLQQSKLYKDFILGEVPSYIPFVKEV